MPISLVYETKGAKPIHIDINSLRPDPSENLETGQKYVAIMDFDSILLPCGPGETEVQVLRTVTIPSLSVKIANIR